MGTVLARRYRLERQLYVGRDALLCAGHDLQQRGPVALKILKRSSSAATEDVGAFVREISLACRVKHANVVEVHELVAAHEGMLIAAMELLGGESLARTLIRRRRLRWARAREIIMELCAGLGAVHAAGIVYCGLSPSNCFRATGRGASSVKLHDFGAARSPGASKHNPLELVSAGKRLDFDPAFASPELAAGEHVDHRSDIYGLGVLLCVLLTGRTPFVGATTRRLLMRNIHDPLPPLSQLTPEPLDVPAQVELAYRRALAKDPTERFASTDELHAALAELPEST